MDIKPSEKMKLKILQSGEDSLTFKSKVPESGLVPLGHKGKRKYKVVCKSCGELLATFWGATRGLEQAIELEGVSTVSMKRWGGCRGINVGEKINFECNCGSCKIVEPSTNEKRYTEYKILLNK